MESKNHDIKQLTTEIEDLKGQVRKLKGKNLSCQRIEKTLASERARLKTLYIISSDQSLPFEKQIELTLRSGVEMMDLDIGIVSMVDGDCYSIRHYHSKETVFEGDLSFSLGNTYCSLTLAAKDVVAINHMRESKYAGHPCYETFALETYIGVPLIVNGKIFGTLNFSSPKPTSKPFNQSDQDFVRLMGRWVGTVLERQQILEKLEDNRKSLEKLVEKRTEALNETIENLNLEITDRMEIETSLRNSKDRFRTLFNNAQVGLFRSSMKDGSIIEANDLCAQLVGYTREELFSKWEFTQNYTDSDERRRLLKELEQNGRVRNFEAQFTKKDGSTIWVSLTARTVPEENCIEGAIININEQKALLHQLQQSQKMESIGTLAGGIAHDFNNILSAILGYTQLTQMNIPEDLSAQTYLSQVENACNRARGLIKQILAFSRKSEVEKKPVDIGIIIKEALKLLRASLPTTIEIQQSVPSDMGTVLADPTQIHQVLMNLCTNASHSMRETGGRIMIGLERIEICKQDRIRYPNLKTGDHLKLSVSDTGCGIKPSVLARIFDPYFTTKEVGEGTGLGLSVVHGIVQDHGGDIEVDSIPDKGTAFNAYFPCIKKETAGTIKVRTENLPTGSEKILFIDDEEDLVDIGEKMLRKLGYSIVSKRDPYDALSTFRDNPKQFDLVVTDMTMPKMTGEILAREITTIRSNIPIILCTGFRQDLKSDQLSKAGIKKVIMKPLTITDLAKSVRTILDQKK